MKEERLKALLYKSISCICDLLYVTEQEKIDSSRGGNGEKIPEPMPENIESGDDEEIPLPDFIENLK